MQLSPDKISYIARAPNVEIDKPTLTRLAEMTAQKSNTVLLGYNDYTKHLINMFASQISHVVDEKYAGISFRGVEVRPMGDFPDCEQMVVCSYPDFMKFKIHYFGQAHQKRIPFLFPDKYGAETTKIVDYIRLDPLYQKINEDAANCPPTMMSEAGMFFILELLRSCLSLDGDVAEVGAWQGGSAWQMARMLHLTGSDKLLHTFEMGEDLASDNPQGIVSHQQMERDLAFYPGARCHFGPAITSLKTIQEGALCFCFIDFGYTEAVLDICFKMLVPGGIMLLDNYGHALGHPDLFDAFFAKHGLTVIRQSKSPVAFVIKR